MTEPLGSNTGSQQPEAAPPSAEPTAAVDGVQIDLTDAAPAPTATEALPPPVAGTQLPPPNRWPDAAERQAAQIALDPPEPRIPATLKPAWVIAAIAAGIAVDIGLRHVPWNNVAGTIMVVVLAAGLVASGFIKTRTSKVMIFGAVFFGLFLTIRTEPRLTAFNIMAAVGLLILGAVHAAAEPHAAVLDGDPRIVAGRDAGTA